MTDELERRELSRFELRTAEDGTAVIDGYATVYDFRYDVQGGPDAGGFTEVISRGAAAKSATEADVKFLVNHDGLPLARTKSGTLSLESDDIGLRVQAHLDPSNPAAQELISATERGDVDQMSFAFKVLRQSWSDDRNVRTISEVKLYDVSAVTYPASAATVMKMRGDELDGETSTTVDEPVVVRSLALAKRQADALRS